MHLGSISTSTPTSTLTPLLSSPGRRHDQQDECSWNPREDYRKPLSRQQVEALRTRVADLERMLRDHGLDPGTGNEGSAVEQVAGGGAGGTIGGTGGRNDGVGGSGGGEGGRPDETRGERGVGADKPMLEGPEDLRDWSQSHLVRSPCPLFIRANIAI
jgi:hypothetical protein